MTTWNMLGIILATRGALHLCQHLEDVGRFLGDAADGGRVDEASVQVCSGIR